MLCSRARIASLALVAAVALHATTARAGADDPSALAAYRAGEEAFKAGDFRRAAQAFESAYRRDPRGASAYNAALAWLAAGDAARAADGFALAIRAPDLPEGFAADARTRLATLERSLGRVDVTAPANARVSLAHATNAPAPATVHVAPGAYEMHIVFADGRERTRTVAVAAGQIASIDVEAPGPMATPVAASATPSTDAPAPASPPASTRRTIAWIALGGAAVFGAAGVYFFVDAKNTRDDYVAKHDATGIADGALHDDAQAALVRSWIAGGLAVASAAAGVVLFLTEPDPARAPASTALVRVGVAPSGVFVHGTFTGP